MIGSLQKMVSPASAKVSTIEAKNCRQYILRLILRLSLI